MPDRPALGRSVLRARAESSDALCARKPEPAESDGEIRLVDREPRLRQGQRSFRPGFFRELRVALGHERNAFRVELVHEVEEAVARFADEPGADGYLRKEGDERG